MPVRQWIRNERDNADAYGNTDLVSKLDRLIAQEDE